jgi:hypothetical protein
MPFIGKTGANPPVVDKRNIMLGTILNVGQLPPLPDSFDVDVGLGVIPDAVDGNDLLRCCVISARAKQTRRFECSEQGTCPDIQEKVITGEYFLETGGPDSGLDVLASLKKWRREGWNIGGRNYRIYAFAAVNWLDHVEVEYALMLFHGIQITLALPASAQHEDVWATLTDRPGSWDYHQVYGTRYLDVIGYDANGVIIRTWGREQRVTWPWWDKYVCACFVVIDDKNYWLPDSPVNTEKLGQLLLEANHTPAEPEPNPLPYPPIPEPEPTPPVDPVPTPEPIPEPEPTPPAPVPNGCNPLSGLIKLFKK